jgi:hypothetical protein
MAEPGAPAPPPPTPSTAVAIVAPPVLTTVRERLAQFKILEDKRSELIEVRTRRGLGVGVARLTRLQELLAKLESTEAKLAQTELDLNSEQNVRRTLQSENAEAKAREAVLAQKQVCRRSIMVLKRCLLIRGRHGDLSH